MLKHVEYRVAAKGGKAFAAKPLFFLCKEKKFAQEGAKIDRESIFNTKSTFCATEASKSLKTKTWEVFEAHKNF